MSDSTSATSVRLSTLETIRGRFPALERRHQGYAVAYLDGPGGTQVPREVVDAAADYLCHHNANTHWAYPTSAETDVALEAARAAFADFFNADPAEVAFGANMTTLTFHLARALGRQLAAADEILTTELEHHGNVAPWTALETERGVRVRFARLIPGTGQIDWKDLERQAGPRTKILALGAASNALGTVNDLQRGRDLARSLGAIFFVDAVHSAPHLLTDVRALDCDFLACSAYKFYGPHVGVLYGKRARLEEVDFPRLAPAPSTAPERAETGTQNHEGIVGAGAAVDFIASLGEGATRRARLVAAYDMLHTAGSALFKRLWNGLRSIEGVTVYGPPPDAPRTPTVAFTAQGVPSTQVARRLAERGLFLSHGDFYAATVVERLGLGPEGLVRAGCACYTSSEEIDRLIEGVQVICASRS
jgi:cysteine desulfurase family protein (TIGR01976 family)